MPSWDTEHARGPSKDAPRTTILIVEDEALIALDLEQQLDALGYEVVGVVDNGVDARERFDSLRPDLVLMDIHLRGSDGVEAARGLLEIADAPIIFITAYADAATVERTRRVSPYGYIIKPFSEQTLAVTLQVALDRYAQDRRLRALHASLGALSLGVLLLEPTQGGELAALYWNDALLELTGEPPTSPFSLDRQIETRGGASLVDALASGSRARGKISCEVDETARLSEVTIEPITDSRGNHDHTLVLYEDITQQRRTEELIAKTQRLHLNTQLSVGMVHDLNNVLTAIVSLSHYLSVGLEGTDFGEDASELQKVAQRGVTTARQFMSLANSKRANDDARQVDLSATLEGLLPVIGKILPKNVKHAARIPTSPLWINGTLGAFEQVILNLVLNARDALLRGGEIELELRLSEPVDGAHREVIFEVKDDGIGMSPETLERLFEPFFSTKPEHRGSGLGMMICQLTVHRAGGEIIATSTQGEGSTITITLPLARPLSVTPGT